MLVLSTPDIDETMQETESPLRVFLSSHAAPGKAKDAIGQPHYSYAFAAEGHLSALSQLDVSLRHMPNSYSVTSQSWGRIYSENSARNVHLIFKNFRSVRLVRWARNIAVLVWEFDDMSGERAAQENPFRDQVRILKNCDEIWVASEHTKAVFEARGVENVFVIPAPVNLAQFADRHERQEARGILLRLPSITMRHGLGSGSAVERPVALGFQPALQAPDAGPVFLAMCNPLDPRKQLRELVRGFHSFWRNNPTATLIIKLSVDPERFPVSELTQNLLPRRVLVGEGGIHNPNIIFVNSFLDPGVLAELHNYADFFISPSRGEGQNLPLQEAMLDGTPVISPSHTAMLDYLTEDNHIPIASQSTLAPLGLEPHYHVAGPVRWYESSAMDVEDALKRAVKLSPKDRAALGKAGQDTIQQNYSSEAIAKLMADRLSLEQ